MTSPTTVTLAVLGWCWIATLNPPAALLLLFLVYLSRWSKRRAVSGR